MLSTHPAFITILWFFHVVRLGARKQPNYLLDMGTNEAQCTLS